MIRTSRVARSWIAALAVGLTIGTVAEVAAQSVEGALDGVEAPQAAADQAREAELDAMTARIGNTLRCPTCRQQSVTESPSRISRAMQGVIRNMLIEGKTPEEIEAYFLEAYGPWILLKPRAEGVNLLVYVLPVAAFLLGALIILRRLRRGRLTAGLGSASPRPLGSKASGQGAESALGEEDRTWIEAAIRGS